MAILKSFTPLIVNNQHSTYQGKNGLLYKFTVVFEDEGVQTTGTANSTKQQPSWKIGDKYTYESTTNNGYVNIKNIKPVEDKFTPKSNPTFVIQKCFEGAYESVFKFFKTFPEHYKDQATEEKFVSMIYNWIMQESDEQKRWIRNTAIKLAVEKLSINGDFYTKDKAKSESLFLIAEGIVLSIEKTVEEQLQKDGK